MRFLKIGTCKPRRGSLGAEISKKYAGSRKKSPETDARSPSYGRLKSPKSTATFNL